MMHRRNFVSTVSTGVAALILPMPAFAKAVEKTKLPATNKSPSEWKTVEISTQISIPAQVGSKVWLPVPATNTSYQDLISTSWDGDFSRGSLVKDRLYSATAFYAEWDKAGPGKLNVSHQVRIRNRSEIEAAPDDEATKYTLPTKHIPLDGKVKDLANKIVKSESNPDKKAQLIYQWMVDNASRDAAVRGCGIGDVKTMLDSGNLSGKCADLSSLFVGLCRAAGVPAREMFGLRVLPSDFFKSIGKSGDVTKGQHCRAEYFSKSRGWVPVDPADVLKVILEEKLKPTDPAVLKISEKFFGFWEMNWIAYNSARDFMLPPGNTDSTNYLMYPHLVSENTEDDGMDPDKFKYTISAKDITVG